MNKTELVQVLLAYNSLKATKEIDGKPVRRDTDFSFDMNYNLKVMEPEIDGIKSLEEQQQSMEAAFNEERLEIIKKKAILDESGNPVVKDDQYQFNSKEDEKEVVELLAPIANAHNEAMKTEVEKYNKFMAQPVSSDIESKLKRHKRNQLDKQLTDTEAQGLSYITD